MPNPPQTDLPSQQVPTQTPFKGNYPYTGRVSNAPIGAPPGDAFTVSVFPDAKPPNGLEFTEIGANGEINYVVPEGFIALVRHYSIDAVCVIGEAQDLPAVTALGESNFAAQIDFFVDGTAIVGSSNIQTRMLPFGTFNGDCYVIGQMGQTITMRVTALDNDRSMPMCALEMSGTLFMNNGKAMQLQPCNTSPVPVIRGAGS